MKESNRIMHVITLSISHIEIKIGRGREIEMERVITVLERPVFCHYYCNYRVFRALISPTHPGTKGTQILSCTHAPGNTQACNPHTPLHGHLHPHLHAYTQTLPHTVILWFVTALLGSDVWNRKKKQLRRTKRRKGKWNQKKGEKYKFTNKYRQMEGVDWRKKILKGFILMKHNLFFLC